MYLSKTRPFLFCAIYNTNLQSWLFLQMMLQFPKWISNSLITLDKFPVYGKLRNVFNLLGNSTRSNTPLFSFIPWMNEWKQGSVVSMHEKSVKGQADGKVIEVFNCPDMTGQLNTSITYDTKSFQHRCDTKSFHSQYAWSVGNAASTKPNPI